MTLKSHFCSESTFFSRNEGEKIVYDHKMLCVVLHAGKMSSH